MDYPDQSITLQKAAVVIAAELSKSYKGQDITQLTPTIQPGRVETLNGASVPVRTDVYRKGMAVENLGDPVEEYEDTQAIVDYMGNPTSANKDLMVAGRHYANGSYHSATLAKPKIHRDRAFFQNWEQLVGAMNPENDKIKSVHANLRNAKNKAWFKALTAPSVMRLKSKNRKSAGLDALYEMVALPEDRTITVDAGKNTLDYFDLLKIRAKCQTMQNTSIFMLMNWFQQAAFKDANKQYLQNKDFVSSADLTKLDESLAFQGVKPVIIEDALDITGAKDFGIDESQIIFFNQDVMTKVDWGVEDKFGIDAQADMAALYFRKERYDFVRTDDNSLFIVNIAALVPTLEVSKTSFTSAPKAGATEQKFTVTTNSNRIEVQSWNVSANVDWITINKKSGFGTGETSFAIAANPTTSARTGTITVKSLGLNGTMLTKTISVAQLGA